MGGPLDMVLPIRAIFLTVLPLLLVFLLLLLLFLKVLSLDLTLRLLTVVVEREVLLFLNFLLDSGPTRITHLGMGGLLLRLVLLILMLVVLVLRVLIKIEMLSHDSTRVEAG